MNSFDLSIINFLNSFIVESEKFSNILLIMSRNSAIKTYILIIIIWWAWFKKDSKQESTRNSIIATLIATFVGLFLARVLTYILPFRLRPMYEESLELSIPNELLVTLDGWSSFPSDHAVLVLSLVTGIFYISKKLGMFVLIYVIIMVLLPRIFLGLHYPTDIIAGSILGIIITIIFNTKYLINKLSKKITNFSYIRPELFYLMFFTVSQQIIILFEGVRAIGRLIKLVCC